MSDASSYAWAAHEARWPLAAIEEHLPWSERWRFAHAAVPPRERALAAVRRQEELQALEEEQQAAVEEGPDFPEIGPVVLQLDACRPLQARRWVNAREPIHIKEFRASLWGARRIARSAASAEQVHLFLTDNLGNAFACEKRRCGDARPLGLLRT